MDIVIAFAVGLVVGGAIVYIIQPSIEKRLVAIEEAIDRLRGEK